MIHRLLSRLPSNSNQSILRMLYTYTPPRQKPELACAIHLWLSDSYAHRCLRPYATWSELLDHMDSGCRTFSHVLSGGCALADEHRLTLPDSAFRILCSQRSTTLGSFDVNAFLRCTWLYHITYRSVAVVVGLALCESCTRLSQLLLVNTTPPIRRGQFCLVSNAWTLLECVQKMNSFSLRSVTRSVLLTHGGALLSLIPQLIARPEVSPAFVDQFLSQLMPLQREADTLFTQEKAAQLLTVVMEAILGRAKQETHPHYASETRMWTLVLLRFLLYLTRAEMVSSWMLMKHADVRAIAAMSEPVFLDLLELDKHWNRGGLELRHVTGRSWLFTSVPWYRVRDHGAFRTYYLTPGVLKTLTNVELSIVVTRMPTVVNATLRSAVVEEVFARRDLDIAAVAINLHPLADLSNEAPLIDLFLELTLFRSTTTTLPTQSVLTSLAVICALTRLRSLHEVGTLPQQLNQLGGRDPGDVFSDCLKHLSEGVLFVISRNPSLVRRLPAYFVDRVLPRDFCPVKSLCNVLISRMHFDATSSSFVLLSYLVFAFNTRAPRDVVRAMLVSFCRRVSGFFVHPRSGIPSNDVLRALEASRLVICVWAFSFIPELAFQFPEIARYVMGRIPTLAKPAHRQMLEVSFFRIARIKEKSANPSKFIQCTALRCVPIATRLYLRGKTQFAVPAPHQTSAFYLRLVLRVVSVLSHYGDDVEEEWEYQLLLAIVVGIMKSIRERPDMANVQNVVLLKYVRGHLARCGVVCPKLNEFVAKCTGEFV